MPQERQKKPNGPYRVPDSLPPGAPGVHFIGNSYNSFGKIVVWKDERGSGFLCNLFEILYNFNRQVDCLHATWSPRINFFLFRYLIRRPQYFD